MLDPQKKTLTKLYQNFNSGFKNKCISFENLDKLKDAMAKNMTSMLYSFNYYKNCEDLIYYVEDDYIHKTDALAEMLFA